LGGTGVICSARLSPGHDRLRANARQRHEGTLLLGQAVLPGGRQARQQHIGRRGDVHLGPALSLPGQDAA
jgi:hypothetical protein